MREILNFLLERALNELKNGGNDAILRWRKTWYDTRHINISFKQTLINRKILLIATEIVTHSSPLRSKTINTLNTLALLSSCEQLKASDLASSVVTTIKDECACATSQSFCMPWMRTQVNKLKTTAKTCARIKTEVRSLNRKFEFIFWIIYKRIQQITVAIFRFFTFDVLLVLLTISSSSKAACDLNIKHMSHWCGNNWILICAHGGSRWFGLLSL